MPVRRDWTRDELIVAFNLYCRIPFGRIHIRNPEIIALARALNRTPSSVSWKLANFARLDPELKKRNIKGAHHGAKAEEEVWNEFCADWDALAFRSEILLAKFLRMPDDQTLGEVCIPEGREREAMVRVRVNQNFFRASVIAAYSCRCCITGLSTPSLLRASHIIPWAKDSRNRTNPCNGLCLNALHDAAFDCGLLTVTPDYEIRIASSLRKTSESEGGAGRELFNRYEGCKINLPDRFIPDPEFLKHHNKHCFQSD
jgi:putative restriction endonuclease